MRSASVGHVGAEPDVPDLRGDLVGLVGVWRHLELGEQLVERGVVGVVGGKQRAAGPRAAAARSKARIVVISGRMARSFAPRGAQVQ